VKKLDILFAFIVAFAWGSNFIALKYTVIEIPGLLSVAIRFAITVLLTLPFAERPTRVNFQEIYITSLILGIFYLGMLYYGIYLGLNTSLAIITSQLNIPFSVIIARFALKEHFTLSSAIGIIIAFMGMVIVVGSPHLNDDYGALLFVLFSSLFCAVFNIQSRKLNHMKPISILCWTNLIAAPHLFLMSYLLEGNPLDLLQGTSMNLWLALLYTIVISGIIGLSLWIYLIQKYPVYKVTPFNFLVPFFGISLTFLMLDEIPSWHIIGGGVVTIFGVLLSQMRVVPFMVNKRL